MLLSNKYTYIRDNHSKRRVNGFHNNNHENNNHGSCGMLKLDEDNNGELSEVKSEPCKDLSHVESHGTNIVQTDAIVDEQCAKVRKIPDFQNYIFFMLSFYVFISMKSICS
jgi:hypothetical protein